MPTLLLGNSRNSRLHQMTRFYSPGSPLRAPPPLFCPLGRRSAAGREALCVEVRTCHSALQSPPPPPELTGRCDQTVPLTAFPLGAERKHRVTRNDRRERSRRSPGVAHAAERETVLPALTHREREGPVRRRPPCASQ